MDLIKFPKKNFLIILLLLGFGEWFVSDLINFAGGSIGFFILCFYCIDNFTNGKFI